MNNLSAFEKKVLQEALKIPLGQTRTYKEIAQSIGCPRAYRAVGSALAKNKFLIFIPCHRVVKSNGDVGNYVLGRKIKKQLIKLEQKIKNMLK